MSRITFLNIDLDIQSKVDISPLVEEWGNRVSVLRNEKVDDVYYGSFETSFDCVDSIVKEYVSLIRGLSPISKQIWDNAICRSFDFGYESGIEPNNFHSRVSAVLVKELAEVGGDIVITIYPTTDA